MFSLVLGPMVWTHLILFIDGGCRPQALLHPYFFSPPLPAHHSELPIPQRGGRPPRQRLQAPPTEFSLDLPLQRSVVDPALLRGHASCLWPADQSHPSFRGCVWIPFGSCCALTSSDRHRKWRRHFVHVVDNQCWTITTQLSSTKELLSVIIIIPLIKVIILWIESVCVNYIRGVVLL